MSDPMKQMEIEDVLSSIRRLVADEVAERAVPDALQETAPTEDGPAQDAAQVETEALHPTEKLVLTADQRVSEDAPKQAEAEEAPVAEDENTAEVNIAEASAAEEEVGETFEASFEEIEEVSGDSSEPEFEADTWEEVSLEDRIAELEQAVAAREEDWEPDGSELTGEEIQFTSLRAVMQDAEEVEPDLPAHEDIQPDMDPADDGDSPQEAREGPEAEAAVDGASEPENMFGAQEPDVMDEEMLRQLVTDIVREELQGTLGERITRNVRKLVRREINTLLATRDFE